MRTEDEGQVLRVYIGESDRREGRPLYEVIVRRARDAGLAGATVLRGLEGFGASSQLHTAKILRLSGDLPIIVEIVDTTARLREFLPVLDELMREGMITLEKAHVIVYRTGRSDSEPEQDGSSSGA